MERNNHIYSKVIKPKKDGRGKSSKGSPASNNDAVTVVPVAPVDPVSVVNVSTDDVKILSNDSSSTIVTVSSPHVQEDYNVSITSPSDQVVVVANSTNKTWLSSNDSNNDMSSESGANHQSQSTSPVPETKGKILDDSEVVVLSPHVDRHSPVDVYEQSEFLSDHKLVPTLCDVE